MNYFLTGNKIGLRAMQRSDLLPYADWLANEEVTRYLEMGWRPIAEADLDSVYQEATSGRDAVVMMICEKESGRPVGTAGLYLLQWPCRRAQFRILLGEPDVYDRGYGTEATRLILDYGFAKLNLETIYLGVNAENVRAIKTYEKAGFVHEGRQRRFIYRNGQYYDCINMSVLRSEHGDSGKR
jgi:ribosomal-protein-alanine N-acetyltransferase